MASAQEAFEILISIGAGTGLLYILRWFWWRINAWTEVVAMISSFAISVLFFMLEDRTRAAVRPHRPLLGRVDDDLLDHCRLCHAADEPRTADRVLSQGPPRPVPAGASFARRPESPRRRRRSTATTWGWRRSVGVGLPDDLVVALRDREFPLRPNPGSR